MYLFFNPFSIAVIFGTIQKCKQTETLKYPIILILLVCTACVKSKNEACPNTPQYQVLTQSAKEWLPYTSTKSIVYEDASQKKDTIELSKLFIGDDTLWVGDKCPTTKAQFVRIDFYDKKSNDTIKTQVGLQDELRIFTKKNNIVFYDSKTLLLDPGPYKKFELNTTLNGKPYSSVLSLECSAADNCKSTGITKIYFSKTKGLVAYIRSGILWTLY